MAPMVYRYLGSFHSKRLSMNREAASAYQNRDDTPINNAIDSSQNPGNLFIVGRFSLWLLDTYHLGVNAGCGSAGQELVKKLALSTTADEFKSILESPEDQTEKQAQHT
jgi:hypothetical protein